MDIDNLSLEEKIGQRFIFGVNNENVDSILYLIKNNFIGGVILYKKNYHSYHEMLELIKKLKKANSGNKIPLFIAIDQEGGKVNRLPNEIHNLKNIYDVSKKNSELVNGYASIISDILTEMGINMNFAPVMDIYNNSRSKALFKRCFAGSDKDVIACGEKYLNGVNNNIVSVIKHFPGHGVTKRDSHFLVPYIYDYQSVNKHMQVFEKMIDSGIDALMIGHLVIRKLTKLWPASISNVFIDNYLRCKYDGLIITDEVNMMSRWPLYHLCYLKKTLKSHSDILLIKIKDKDEGIKILDKYIKYMDKHELDDSVKRIIKVKKKYKVNDNINYDGVNVDNVNKIIDEFNNKIESLL